jgi:serine/threonine-protein kinase
MCTGASPDRNLVLKVISEVIERRGRGERISFEQVMASHPELMPDLGEELQAAGEIHQAVMLGQERGTSDSRIDKSNELNPAPGDATNTSLDEYDPHKGLRLQGYLIDREISSGGQATVFKAVQERTGRSVAIKIMHGGPYMGSRGRTRFERESTILASLNHPNVVTILDRGRTADGSFFLVMDFIEGPDLDGFVRKLGKDSAAIVGMFVKIANAIDEAHRQGIVHRDLKPMNILVDCRGEPHILDFGMARLLRDDEDGENAVNARALTRTGQVLGTLPWTSPEQLSGSPDRVDARSDIYALGVMLFAALSGQFPYPVDGNLRSIRSHIANTPPAPLRSLARGYGMRVSCALQETVRKALAKMPNERYESAGLLARDLEACLAGKSRGFARSTSRHLRPILLLAMIAALALTSFDDHSYTRSNASFVNSFGMSFVRIQLDERGSELLPNGHHAFDFRQAAATLSPKAFYMSTTLVTQEQFLRVMGHNPSRSLGPDLPVQYVTWDEATQFCKALSEREKRTYRLPTATEWKFAWRTGGSSKLSRDTLNGSAWFAGNSGSHLHPVAQKVPDRFGLYDMIGDVRQWCSASIPPFATSTANSAVAGKPAQPVEGADYTSPASKCLAPSELECPPATSQPFIGFRVVCESSDLK